MWDLKQSWCYFQACFSLRVYFPYIDLITAVVVFSFVIVWSWFMAIIVHMWPSGFIVDYLPEIDCRFPKERATTRNNFPFPFCSTHLFYFEFKKSGLRRYKWQCKVFSIERAIHYGDVIMNAMAPQITSLTIVYSIVPSGADKRIYQSSASLNSVSGIQRWPVKGSVKRNMFPFDDLIMLRGNCMMKRWVVYIWKQKRTQGKLECKSKMDCLDL